MAIDLTVILEDRPGTLADLGEALGAADINIDGICGFPCEGVGVVHLLVQDPSAARAALEATGIEVRAEREVLVVPVEDRPGVGGAMARRLADAGVNVGLVYTATGPRAVIGVDDLEAARAALG